MKIECCGNCGWSRWELTRKGNIKRGTSGACEYEVKMPVVPSCQRALVNDRVPIWPDRGKFCPFHRPGLKPQAKVETAI